MLTPELDRLDYGEQLNPPVGFELDVAIATTYSLDLNALLAVPVALSFHGNLDGDLKGEKLALLEAIGQLKDKVRVYYQKGNISVPPKFNRLFTLLEPCLEPIVPQGGAFSSFHPKLWLLRFIESKPARKKPAVTYRLLVLSRNLTFDRSWDVAVTLDGRVDATVKQSPETLQWTDFITELLNGSTKPFPAGTTIKKELKRVIWKAPEKFTEVNVLVGNEKYGRPVNVQVKNIGETLVVSPFLSSSGGDISGLEWLAGFSPEGEKYLFSRAGELNSIGPKKLEGWKCYSVNDNLVNCEELHELVDTAEGDYPRKQDLHAKIIVQQRGGQSFWHIGSANVTAAALGDGNSALPRNTETMLAMKGPSSKVGPNLLRDAWTNGDGQGLFVEHVFSQLTTEGDNLTQLLRRGVHQLICASWKLRAVLNEEGTYDLTLTVIMDKDLDDNLLVTVKQLAFVGERSFCKVMVWEGVPLTSISAFIPLQVKTTSNGEPKEKRLIIEANVEIEGGDDREKQIVKSMVDSPKKVLNYLMLLMQVTPDKGQWLASDGEGDGDGISGEIFLSSNPILEQLLMISSRHPEKLKRIEDSLQRLHSAEVEIPKEFTQLWKQFHKGAAK